MFTSSTQMQSTPTSPTCSPWISSIPFGSRGTFWRCDCSTSTSPSRESMRPPRLSRRPGCIFQRPCMHTMSLVVDTVPKVQTQSYWLPLQMDLEWLTARIDPPRPSTLRSWSRCSCGQAALKSWRCSRLEHVEWPNPSLKVELTASP